LLLSLYHPFMTLLIIVDLGLSVIRRASYKLGGYHFGELILYDHCSVSLIIIFFRELWDGALTDLSIVEAALVKYFREPWQKIKAHIGLCFRIRREAKHKYFNVFIQVVERSQSILHAHNRCRLVQVLNYR
jgi:hypothetical protein